MPALLTAAGAAELVVDARHGVGESPVWRTDEQALYGVDIPARRVWRWSADSGMTGWDLAEMPGCLAHVGGTQWVAGMETGFFDLWIAPGAPAQAHRRAAVSHAQGGMRFNDGRCDRQGRLLAGTMVMDMGLAAPAGRLYQLSDGAGPRVIADGLITPNGMAFSPDGRTLYLNDSHPASQQVWAFDYDPDSGTPSRRRVFVDMRPLPGRPDGAAVDVDGCYWVCANDAGLVHRFTPAGQLDRSIALPVKKPAMCAFGGSGLDTLYVTSIRPAGTDLSDQPLAGGLFAVRPGVQGLPEPRFRAQATAAATH